MILNLTLWLKAKLGGIRRIQWKIFRTQVRITFLQFFHLGWTGNWKKAKKVKEAQFCFKFKLEKRQMALFERTGKSVCIAALLYLYCNKHPR